MSITTIILSHHKEREGNLKRIVDDLLTGTVKPEKIIIFSDSPDGYQLYNRALIEKWDERVTIIRSDKPFLPIIRFALGMVSDTDYCFFIDDDLTVRKKTLENLVTWSETLPDAVLGFEGSVLGKTETPYSNDTCITRGDKRVLVDIVIRTYFVPTRLLSAGFQLRIAHPYFPKTSLDDVFLCLGNKYLNYNKNWVIPVNTDTDVTELPDGGVGQSRSGEHYTNRNIVCRKLMDIYE